MTRTLRSMLRTRTRLRALAMALVAATAPACILFACVSLDGVAGGGAAADDGGVLGDALVGADSDADLPGRCGAGRRALPPAPPDWSVVAFALERASCPPGTGSALDVAAIEEGADGGAPCTCACKTLTKDQCTSGTFGVAQFSNTACTSAPTMTPLASAPACGSVSLSVGAGSGIEITPAAVVKGTCEVVAAAPPPVSAARACRFEGASDCVPQWADPFNACIMHEGTLPCPSGYDDRFGSGASSSADDRACSPCTCGTPGTCNSAFVVFSNNGSCSGTGQVVDGTGTCQTIGAGTYNSYRYHAQYADAGSCAPTSPPPTMSGSVTFATPRTICCVR